MNDVFHSCTLPWAIWPWGLQLTYSDTDVGPECSVAFGVQVVRAAHSHRELWVKADFELAGFVVAKPHRDDEDLSQVSGYDIVPRRGPESEQHRQRAERDWIRSGVCPDPGVYFSTTSTWLEQVRQPWAERQRTRRSAHDAVHFLLGGRDGYLEIIAAGFAWQAWAQGRPMLSDVSGDPVMSGEWIGGSDPPDDRGHGGPKPL